MDLLKAIILSRMETQPTGTVYSIPPSPYMAPHSPHQGSDRRETGVRLTKAPSTVPGPMSMPMYTPTAGPSNSSGTPPPPPLPLPQRPTQSRPITAPSRSSTAPISNYPPPPPIPHVVYPKLGRTPSPEKRTAFLTTLRTKKPQRKSQIISQGRSGTASQAAGLAWGAISRGDGGEPVRAGSAEHLVVREPHPPAHTRQSHSSSDLPRAQVPMPDPQKYCPPPRAQVPMPDPQTYCPPPRANGPSGPRPRPQSTIIQPNRTSTMPQVLAPRDPQAMSSSSSKSSPRHEKPNDLVSRPSFEAERRLSIIAMSQKGTPPSSEKSKRMSIEGPLAGLTLHPGPYEPGPSRVSRKPLPVPTAMERSESHSSYSSQEDNEEHTPTDDWELGEAEDEGEVDEEELQQQQKAEAPDGEQLWKERVEKALLMLDKGVDSEAVSQILNEIVVKGDEVHWDDVAGLEAAKTALKEAVVYPFLRPDLFRGLREPARGMLLFGPPGTGKVSSFSQKDAFNRLPFNNLLDYDCQSSCYGV